MPDKTVADLSLQWEQTWARCLPYAPALKTSYPDRWVRFHSLPDSKRYPGDETEYMIVLDRYNTVLNVQHATSKRDQEIAVALNALINAAMTEAETDAWKVRQ